MSIAIRIIQIYVTIITTMSGNLIILHTLGKANNHILKKNISV
ncbi:MAG: hypothetical protein K0S61_238 [Anaerocolumna sp.]|jgi:hypothetical protein|nr:hypothetical protein [Anaerocolumna sp.]